MIVGVNTKAIKNSLIYWRHQTTEPKAAKTLFVCPVLSVHVTLKHESRTLPIFSTHLHLGLRTDLLSECFHPYPKKIVLIPA